MEEIGVGWSHLEPSGDFQAKFTPFSFFNDVFQAPKATGESSGLTPNPIQTAGWICNKHMPNRKSERQVNVPRQPSSQG
jgi:hypothetical protein